MFKVQYNFLHSLTLDKTKLLKNKTFVTKALFKVSLIFQTIFVFDFLKFEMYLNQNKINALIYSLNQLSDVTHDVYFVSVILIWSLVRCASWALLLLTFDCTFYLFSFDLKMDLKKVSDEEKLNLCKKYFYSKFTVKSSENLAILNIIF